MHIYKRMIDRRYRCNKDKSAPGGHGPEAPLETGEVGLFPFPSSPSPLPEGERGREREWREEFSDISYTHHGNYRAIHHGNYREPYI